MNTCGQCGAVSFQTPSILTRQSVQASWNAWNRSVVPAGWDVRKFFAYRTFLSYMAAVVDNDMSGAYRSFDPNLLAGEIIPIRLGEADIFLEESKGKWLGWADQWLATWPNETMFLQRFGGLTGGRQWKIALLYFMTWSTTPERCCAGNT